MKCGIVDVGSNTIQITVYRWEGTEFRALFNQWETVGLAGYAADGVLSSKGMDAACRTLSRFRDLLENLEIRELHAFATASLRGIRNSAEALAYIKSKTGVSLELLSGEEEARYSFRGAMPDSPSPSGLMADIGGGSTELVRYENGAPVSAVSLPFGAVSLFSQDCAGLFPTAGERAGMAARLSPFLERAAGTPCPKLLGVGGTVRAVVGLCNALSGVSPDNRTVSICEVNSLYSYLSEGGKDALRLILRAAPDRVHTVLPGLVILTELMGRCGAESLTMSAGGVREGFLLYRVMGCQASAL